MLRFISVFLLAATIPLPAEVITDPGAPTGTQAKTSISVPFTMPTDGELTLGLFDQSGRLLRWLVQDDYRNAGANRQPWDGLDQWGQPVPAGTYNLKAAYHAPITLDYLLTVANPGTPPWPTPDDHGDWLSDEATPQGVATDGKWIFLAAPGSEKGFSAIGLDEKGQRQWGLKEEFNPRSVSLALAGDYLYVLYSGPEITDKSMMYTGHNAIGRAVLVCLDKRTGQFAKFSEKDPRLKIATWPYREVVSPLWNLRNKKTFSPFNYGGQPRYSNIDVGESTNALGIAVAGGKIYVSLAYENRLLVLDAETGQPTGESIPIASPAGLCALNEQTLLAVSQTRIMRIDLASRNVAPFISNGLVAPDSIAIDHLGKIYVSDWGDSFQVKVFDPAGKFLRAIGKPGGRPWVGKWNPNGMLVPRGIGVTAAGQLWVAEDDGSPKRVSVWDANTGAFIRDYIGPAPYGGGTHFWIDPHDPTEVHTEGTRFKVDYTKRTSIPQAIDYRKADQDAPFTPNGHDLNGRQVRILYHDGREYAVANLSWKLVSILQRKGDVYQPVAALGSFPYDSLRALTPDSDAIFTWDSDIMNHVFPHYYPAFFAGHMENNFAWTDGNGDGRVQPGEMQWLSEPASRPYSPGAQAPWATSWNIDIAPDFTAFFPERFADKLIVMRLGVRGWTSSGAPIYNPGDARPIIVLPGTRNINALHITNDGKLIVAYDYEYHGPDAHDSIECFDLDGHSLWSIAMPATLNEHAVHANCVAYDYSVPGIGDSFCTWAYHGSQKAYFFTTDGLYIGTVLDETLLGPTATWSESERFFYQSPKGERFLINGADQAEHIFKVRGLEKAGRFAGSYSFAPDEVKAAAAWRDLPRVEPPPKPLIRVTWLDSSPKIDGDLSEWNMSAGVSLDGGAQRKAEIALGRDDSHLYLACRVHEPTPPLVNGGKDWRDLFISGDGVDLMLGTDPKADVHRHDAETGDERLFLTVFQGRPMAILYQPVVPGATAPLRLDSAQVDRIVRLDSATVTVQRDAQGGCYNLEASIPLRDLSVDPVQENPLRGDVGVIFADESGHNRIERVYYYNKNTSIVADLPTETRLQPGEWGAVEFPLGPNLIRNGGFEEPMVDSIDKMDRGWFAARQENGSTVSLSTESSYTGHNALLMETRVSPSVPPSEYADPDYDGAFLKIFNGGAGGGHAEIMQKVPVIAGHSYRLRYFYRGADFQEERKEPGHPRGYIVFAGRLEWQCQPPNPGSTVGVGDTKVAPDDWQEITDFQHGYDLPRPYVAPPGAISATIHFELVTNAENHHPRVFLDDVEFVDMARRASP
jgi:DNA-binding beta-propeller fold protein YncE